VKGNKGTCPVFNVVSPLPAMWLLLKWLATVSERCTTQQHPQNTNLKRESGFLKKSSSDIMGFFVFTICGILINLLIKFFLK
jgi:hypothetical protein